MKGRLVIALGLFAGLLAGLAGILRNEPALFIAYAAVVLAFIVLSRVLRALDDKPITSVASALRRPRRIQRPASPRLILLTGAAAGLLALDLVLSNVGVFFMSGRRCYFWIGQGSFQLHFGWHLGGWGLRPSPPGFSGLTVDYRMVLVVVVVLGVMVIAWRSGLFRRREPATGESSSRCPTCAYDLTGNVSGICPECGRPVDAA